MSIDGADEIKRCLTCKQKSCTNCLEREPKLNPDYRSRPIDKIDPETGVVVTYYPTISKASKDNKISAKNIAKLCQSGRIYHGYLWRDHTNKEG